MTTTDAEPLATDSAVGFRMRVVAESTRLFSEQGYDATTVDEVAAASGTSRRTLFRLFHSKEDLIFVDHETLLAQVEAHLDDSDAEPWLAVCGGAKLVFAHYATHRDLAVRRYAIVSQTPALRDRELVATYRYQRLFEDFLRARVPDIAHERIIAFSAAVTGVHNYLLRSLLRGEAGATPEHLDAELRMLCDALVP
ncbi:putative TetR family transcriptional regulator [Gordonia araii NBRC 100433]|uniref:Putative TetR family transcriptional regulator n=1 Tax=Gordonia araii NBRC 100433 TaxID=1073574 RepID=G7GYR3_9ACTN|nr:TetR/AcrR family transcriptional regulator [Gordonia araii]NNG98961.1 TetR family transcriptional regulator [Gordonia araii NBRC 100433]GAB08738.1 putative TetR family transcriptional regulator [Gordonia araii NBRC 100433]